MPTLAALLKRAAELVAPAPEGRAELRDQLARHFGRHRWVTFASAADRVLVIGVRRIVERRAERGGLTDAEIDLLLEHDIEAAEQMRREAYPWTDDLDPVRRAVLTELVIEPGVYPLSQIPGFLAGVELGLRGDPAGYLSASRALLSSSWATGQGFGRPDELARQLTAGTWT